MKKTSLSLWAILSFALSVTSGFASPNRWAQNGFLDVFYSYPQKQGLLSISVLHLGGGYSNDVYGHVYSSIGFAPLSFLEFSAAVHGDGYRTDDNNYLIGPIKISPALKIGYPFYLGANKRFFISPGLLALGDFSTSSFWNGDSTTQPPTTSAFDGRLIFGLGIEPVNFNINAGYGISFDSLGSGSTLPYGISIEVSPLKFLSFGCEVSNRASMDSFFSISNMTLVPLIRMKTAPAGGVTFDLSAPIGIGNSVPPWKIEIGVSVGFDLMKPPKPPMATLAGKVISEETGEGLSAKISFPGSEIQTVYADSLTGIFTLGLSPGAYRVRAEAEGYKWIEQGIILQDKEAKLLDFALVKIKEPRAQLSGIVRDNKSAEAIEGVLVSFGDSSIPEVRTDVLGIFKVTLPPGSYSLTFSKEGYASENVGLTLQDGDVRELNVGLGLPKPRELPEFQNIFFRPGSAEILEDSYPALEEVAVFLKEYPDVRIEIQGHTDSIGDEQTNLEISQKRADAVRDLLINQGIDSTRLMSRGYGETRPIGDNRTRKGQEENRRIEFVIVSE